MDDAVFSLAHGAQFPFDHAATAIRPPQPATDWAHAAARGVFADLGDRRGVKQALSTGEIDLAVRREMVQAIAAIIRQADRHRWKGIESAPRDGTPIDVWLGDALRADVEFYCTPGTRFAPGWAWREGKFRPVMGLKVAVFVQPTHWRPVLTEGPAT